MPIANCHIEAMPDGLDPNDIVAAWSWIAGIEPDEMTVDL